VEGEKRPRDRKKRTHNTLSPPKGTLRRGDDRERKVEESREEEMRVGD
jgi:hypothetical protein